jgi:glutamate transport system substrate-binding protein
MFMAVTKPLFAIALATVLVLTACDRAPDKPTPPASSSTASGSPVIVGIKVDQFGTGYLDIAHYRYSGFDVSTARYLAHALLGVDDPYFLPVSSQTREPTLTNGAIRFFAATYTMTAQRAAQFDLAGPYLVTTQGVMVGAHSPAIHTPNDLKGRRVCVNGKKSLSEDVLVQHIAGVIPVEEDDYHACLDDLRNGNVDAFSTDSAILYGYAGDPANRDLHVVHGLTVATDIMYGVAFRKSDHELCLRAKDAIKQLLRDTWWDDTFKNDLPVYASDYFDYQTSLKPTANMVEQFSCKSSI